MSKDIISTLVIQFKKGLPLLAWKSGLSSFSRFANNEYITGTGGETRLLLINYVHANECWVSDRYIGSYIFTYLLKLLDSDQKQRKNQTCSVFFFKIKTLTMSKGIVRKWRSWTCESAANIWCNQQQISTNGGNIQPLRILERLCSTHSSVNLQKRRALGAIWIHLDNLDRGWYLGRTVGSRFCSCKVALPNPNHYIFHAQAKKKITTKVQSQPG